MSPGGDSFLPEAALELRCRVMRCELSNGRREEEAGPGKGPGAGSSRARGEERNRPGGGGPWCRGAQGQDVGGDQVGSPSVACRAVGRVD